MNERTVKAQLNEYLAKGTINFYELQCIEREIGSTKLMKDLTTQEREIIISYIKKK